MNDFLIDILEIKACPGGQLNIDKRKTVECGDYKGDVRLSGSVCNNDGIYLLCGRITGTLSAPCSRCLTPVSINYDTEIELCFANIAFSADAADDVFVFEGDCADLEVPVQGIIRADVPISVMCSEECKGLCEICGNDLNYGNCGCVKGLINPVIDINSFFIE